MAKTDNLYPFLQSKTHIDAVMLHIRCLQFFFPGGTRGSPIRWKFCQFPPIQHLSPFLDQGLSPPPAEVRPWKFEKFKYIFVSNLTTFKLKSTLKSCISCLKYQIWPNFALSGQFLFQSDFFSQVPPSGETKIWFK